MNGIEVHNGYINIIDESFIFSIEDSAVSQVAPVVIHEDGQSIIAFVDRSSEDYCIKIYKANTARNNLERVAVVDGFACTWHASSHLFHAAMTYLHS